MNLAIHSYPSRTDKEAGILRRRDPVVHESDERSVERGLTASQVRNYRRNGFIVLREVFSAAETGAFLGEASRMAGDPQVQSREETVLEPGSTTVRSVFMIHRLNELFKRLVSDPRLVNVASQLLGSEVYVHQSRLNLKPGFEGKEFYWHSDFETWHIEDGMPAMRALSCSILLTDNDETNGPLMLIPGSHMHYISCVGETPPEHFKQSLRKQEYGVPDRDSLTFLAERGGIRAAKGRAGSVVFFDCNTMHGSNSNISPYPRSNVFFVYNSVENRLGNPSSGQPPRPEYIAARQHADVLTP